MAEHSIPPAICKQALEQFGCQSVDQKAKTSPECDRRGVSEGITPSASPEQHGNDERRDCHVEWLLQGDLSCGAVWPGAA
jgi:hypothetical protein